ncbi:MAG: ATPase, T2SS/T4P/T4SS family [Microthrixaceae bacterium]
MQAALTGHFVLSSLHAVDSVAAVHRFTDMGLEPFLVASALSAVWSASGCCGASAPVVRRRRTRPPPTEIRIVDEQVGHQPTVWLKQATGCNMCANTGYRGRVGVYELLHGDRRDSRA